jgi:hypothetical protein
MTISRLLVFAEKRLNRWLPKYRTRLNFVAAKHFLKADSRIAL